MAKLEIIMSTRLIFLVISILLFLGLMIIMATTKTPLAGIWIERFQDVVKLNEYAADNKLILTDVIIENYKLIGAKLSNAKFENTDWKNISITESVFTNTNFKDTFMENVNFSNSTFSNVTFENVNIKEARFYDVTLQNVHFIKCVIDGSNLDRTKHSNIIITDSTIINSSLSEGQLAAEIKNSILKKGTEFTDLTPPSSLSFENGELDFDLSRSSLEKLSIIGSTLKEAGGIKNSIKEVSLKDVKGDSIVLGYSTIDKTTIESSELDERGFSIPDAKIKFLTVIGANHGVVSIDGKHGEVKIINSTILELDFDGATIDSLLIQNSKIEDGVLEKIKAKKLELDNVTLDGPMNFKDAQIDQFINKNTTQTPRAVIDLSGSNIKF